MPGKYNYTDYATIDEDAYVASNAPINKMKGGVVTPFPQKLHKILDQGIHAEIISWSPHGRCFLIHQQKPFAQIVLPQSFHTTKKTSFTRQLNLYGFVRLLSNGSDKGGYYHEKFLRGKSKLCKCIKRIPLKGSEHSLCADSQQEPKFYSMSCLVPQISNLDILYASASSASKSSNTVNERITQDNSKIFDRNIALKEASFESTFSRDYIKEPSSTIAFDSKTKFFISQYF
ncbi:hypothetical protein CTEN210_11799 [Chaetoceros tenuissimus]|uniref:HSF-type DNA-binding domain-containing protein n=1 Tax=Chaetoceros tenuissimus TaxID=426638 RepID=A0AAD3H9W0_9STRA|nr:hypothetical protein CTEN210_11799 [Chaetoceros tenuissimus]